MADLRRARSDLATFAHAVGLPLTDQQAGALTLERRTTAVSGPRQSGKSRSLAAVGLRWAYARPNQVVLVVSAGESASRRLLRQAAAVAVGSPLLAGSVVDETAGRLVLSNGSVIISVPASAAQIRGLSVDLLLVDEAVQIDPDLLLSACLPTVAARPDGRIVLVSSPGAPEGPFFDFATSESESVATARWGLQDAPWISSEVIEQAREQLPPSVFAREIEGRFSDAGDETIIPREWITQAQERTLDPDESVVFGVDLARGHDATVAVRLDGGQLRVAWSNHDPDLMRTAARIAEMLRAVVGPEPPAMLDVTGLGHGVFDRCRELDVNVLPFVASARAASPDRHLNLRAQAWFEARECFRLGSIDLDPEDGVLASQLAAQKFTIASSGALQVASKVGQRGSPDRADAAVLAIFARSQKRQAAVYSRLAEQLTRDAEQARVPPSTEATFRGTVPLEVAWGRQPRREKIVPDRVFRSSAGGRFES